MSLRTIPILLFIISLITACQGPVGVGPTRVSQPTGAASPQPLKHTPTAPDIASVTPSTPPTLAPTALPRLDQPLVWCLRGSATGSAAMDLARVNERLDRELALRGLNAQVEMRVIERSTFDRHLSEMAAQSEYCDLISLTAGRFAADLQNQKLLPLTAYPDPETGQVENLLERDAPGLWTGMPPAGWEAVRRGGVISAVPNPGIWVRPRGVTVRADVVRALNLQAELSAVQTYADLTPVFAKIQSAISAGTLNDLGIANGKQAKRVFAQADLLDPLTAGYDPLALPFVVRCDDPKLTVVNWYTTPEFKQLAELRRDWQNAGFAPPAGLTPREMVLGYQDGLYLAAAGVPVWPGSTAERAALYGYEWVDQPISPAFIPSAAPLASLTGVSAQLAGDPLRARRAVMLLDRLYSDVKIINLLAYGIEGEHWIWQDRDNKVISLLPGSRYQPDFVEQLGSRALLYSLQPASAASTPETGLLAADGSAIDQANRAAPVSTALGFAFDSRPVAGEVATLAGLTPEWLTPLSAGLVAEIDPYIRRMNQALAAPGLDALEAELTLQLDAWRNASIISSVNLYQSPGVNQ